MVERRFEPQFEPTTFQRDLPELCAEVRVAPFPKLEVAAFNEDLGAQLGISATELLEAVEGAQGVAVAYAGHQFGQLVPSLGDGRALTLGQFPQGLNGQPAEVGLKGSGRTPFSRGGDGLATLGPMLREYLVSEAMHALGIPTTRSLAVLTTGQKVQRRKVEPGAVLVRVAASQVRVGTFEFVAMRSHEVLQRLLGHTYSLLSGAPGEASHDVSPAEQAGFVFDQVVRRQAALVAQWMKVGFVHGVMNTDNVQLFGQTIDYGPCAFLDSYDPDAKFSSIDTTRRYRFSAQPEVMAFNLARFAECLLPFAGEQVLMEQLGTFQQHFDQAYRRATASTFGVSDGALAQEFLDFMQAGALDYTATVRGLAEGIVPSGVEQWEQRWRCLEPDFAAMRRSNPVYIPRNHVVEEVLKDAERGDFAPFEQVFAKVTNPFEAITEDAALDPLAVGPGPDAPEIITYCGT
ncbi:protein adenylyltransferase SelO family protein [Corynebacterium sp. 153RC1]|uniref:protein adenylyltransferase SelO family protein n=1 Tax=unclassified Corynebacterium TaxID=2624378 RepID=UPI00211C32A0|nr:MULTISPECIES: protein adenylyltransferase SelO family protein [unclassified Corynebacterium]MCQ9371005.1 protein adenylyltransferase SelO family protein [Corynebacterium sp. 35RC1]MCQ9351610.1 protein adenylyltransferase SelO family protein [Corynebacterium sp. 209RC1]MCQ9353979.1 protein adenylyltransferase SelO family protein [Corynebacterium sp. 1222RC1]MCQ9355893.1 protein adenylyltransferase SelO family protein [Corynebacterium sp. 122RC1]MCQ9358137.1 protein adenylyltransferase SelO f